MAKISQPAQQFEVWDEGTYPARVASIEMTKSTYPGSEDKDRLKWVIKVTNPESGEVADIWHWTNATLSAHKLATFRPAVAALMPGLNLDDPQLEVDTDDLIGKTCRVILGIDEARGRNRIEKLLASTPRAKAAAPAAKVTKPPVDEDPAVADDEDAPSF